MSAAVLEYDFDTLPISGQFRRVAQPRVETYGYLVPVPAVPASVARPLPLFSFVTRSGEIKRLRTPLMLRVSIEDGDIFVENDALNIFGHGKTLHGAIESFSLDLAHFWTYYRDLSSEQVAGDGEMLKKLYEDLVV